MIIRQNTPEWLEVRKNKVGASDAPAILGVSPYRTAYQIYLEKMNLSEQENSYAMQYGSSHEEIARKIYCEEAKIMVMPRVYVHPEKTFLMASCDGVDFDEEIIVEIKCHGKSGYDAVRDGKIVEHDLIQVLMQMETSGITRAHYVNFWDGKIAWMEIKRDDSRIREIVPELENFYFEHMVKKVPPKMSSKDYQVIESERRKEIGLRLLEISTWKQELEQEEKMLKKVILDQSPGQNSTGSGVKAFRSVMPGAIQYDQIPELKTVNLENYRKPSYVKWSVKVDEKAV